MDVVRISQLPSFTHKNDVKIGQYIKNAIGKIVKCTPSIINNDKYMRHEKQQWLVGGSVKNWDIRTLSNFEKLIYKDSAETVTWDVPADFFLIFTSCC